MSIRENILNAKIKKLHEVSITDPEWGIDKLYIKLMNGRERLAFQKAAQAMKGNDESQLIPFVLIHTVCDSDGTPIFSSDDSEAILNLNGSEVDKLLTTSLRVNGLMENSTEDTKKN